jgi:uncharacterized membrane protein YhaH (DUF805 family)
VDEFVTAYQNALQRYADFKGRTSVGGFWRFVAVNFAIAIVLVILAGIADIFYILYFLYAIALIVPNLAVTVRRLHDTGRSGWFLLVGLIPFVGFIILIVLTVQPSTGPNEYGQGPED